MKPLLVIPLLVGGPLILTGSAQVTLKERPMTATASRQGIEKESQREAVRKFPDLAKPGTAMHRAFMEEYNRRKVSDPKFFEQANWPLRLASEIYDEQNPPTAPTGNASETLSEADVAAQASFAAGFKEGFVIGKADAAGNRPRDTAKANRLSKLQSETHSGDKKAYVNGYQNGYNKGWHSQ